MESENRKNSKEFEEFPLIENIVGRGAKATHDPLPVEKRPFFCTILAAKKIYFPSQLIGYIIRIGTATLCSIFGNFNHILKMSKKIA